MMLQMPRFGTTKLVDRVFINPSLDLTDLLSSTLHTCVICEDAAEIVCRECVGPLFRSDNRVFFYCCECSVSVHKHTRREKHKPKKLEPTLFNEARSVDEPDERVLLDLFAVVCINTSHYVSFVKCGEGVQEKWVFFDSMADREGMLVYYYSV